MPRGRNTYVKILPDGSEVGRHPDELEVEDFIHTATGFSAIKAKCLDCVLTAQEVTKCVQYTCPLWAFRLGRNPKALRGNLGKHRKGKVIGHDWGNQAGDTNGKT